MICTTRQFAGHQGRSEMISSRRAVAMEGEVPIVKRASGWGARSMLTHVCALPRPRTKRAKTPFSAVCRGIDESARCEDQPNALMPVTSCPRISVWMSCVPSYV